MKALRYLRARNPFPGVSRAGVPHFCQTKCSGIVTGCVNTPPGRWNAAYDPAPPSSNLSPARAE